MPFPTLNSFHIFNPQDYLFFSLLGEEGRLLICRTIYHGEEEPQGEPQTGDKNDKDPVISSSIFQFMPVLSGRFEGHFETISVIVFKRNPAGLKI